LHLKKAEQRFNLTTRDYAKLAEFRRALRAFLRFSEAAAADVGLTAQHYQAMLSLRAAEEERPVTINDLAQELLIKHNSAVGLVDRLVRQRLVARGSSTKDRRKVELSLTAEGRKVLGKLAAMHRQQLQTSGPVIERHLADLSRPQRRRRR
jgi:DNA-binding MarR family transcriptional regulator